MIVDDDEVIRSLLRVTLPEEGYDLLEAKDGDQALQIADARQPALVVLDWRMPGISGEEVLTTLKQQHPDVPVIVLTAKTLNGRERSKLQRRAVSLLEKNDYSAEELRRLVERAVG